jgi:hypothetical protein
MAVTCSLQDTNRTFGVSTEHLESEATVTKWCTSMVKCACTGIRECRKFADTSNLSYYILASSDKGRVGHLDGLCGKQVVKGRRLCSTCCKRTAAQKKMMSGGMQQQTQANAAVLDAPCTDGKIELEPELSCDDLDVLPTAGCRSSVAMILDSPKEPMLRKRVKRSTIRDNVHGDDIHHLEDYAIDIYKQMNRRICRRDVGERTQLNACSIAPEGLLVTRHRIPTSLPGVY